MILLPDTTHWIRWLGNRSLPGFDRPGAARGIALTAIALTELWTGVRSEQEAEDLTLLHERARRRRRLVTPPAAAWIVAGQTVAALARRGLGSARLRGMRYDVLLAATAALLGAEVLTANRRDFETIARVLTVRWTG